MQSEKDGRILEDFKEIGARFFSEIYPAEAGLSRVETESFLEFVLVAVFPKRGI